MSIRSCIVSIDDYLIWLEKNPHDEEIKPSLALFLQQSMTSRIKKGARVKC
ncbi:TPA: hypothetical protein ACXYK5_003088 [Legionella pneumophila]